MTIRDVPIPGHGGNDFIHEIRVKGEREGLPVIVMIHGYMSGGMQFCKMMKSLRKNYEVVTCDLLGMGASSRSYFPEEELKSFDGTMNFFINSIHKWTKATNIGQNGAKFHLLGHSMGGTIAGHYALAHPEQCETLILMSAVGVGEMPEHL